MWCNSTRNASKLVQIRADYQRKSEQEGAEIYELCVTIEYFQMAKLLQGALFLLIVLLFTGCKWFQPTAYFFISNTSRDKRAVDIKVSIADKTVLSDTLRYTGIQPDLSTTPYISLPKGKYIIRVSADNGKANAAQPVDLGSNRWIFISYSYTPPIDTAHANLLLKNFGNDTSWVNPQLRGFPPSVTIYIMDKEPVHM